MGYSSLSLLGKPTVRVAAVSLVAATLELIFGRLLSMEPLGLLSFGFFCIGSTVASQGVSFGKSIGGDAYLRPMPDQYTHRGMTAWEKKMKTPAMLYLHPWEIDPYQPFIPLSLKSTIRQTWGTTTMEHKLHQLLNQYHVAPVLEVHKNLLAGQAAVEQAMEVAG